MADSRSGHATPIRQLMTTDVRTASRTTRLVEIGRLLVEVRCHHVPVVDGGRVVGIVSHRDLVRVAGRRGVGSVISTDVGRITAEEVMSTELETIGPDETVDIAIDRIGRGDIHALVVLDRDDALAGIVTHHDLLRYLMT